MSAIFTARIDNVDRSVGSVKVTLTQTVADANEAFPDHPGCGLFLLIESAQFLDAHGKQPMTAEGHGVDQLVDHDWLMDNASKYVTSFDLLDLSDAACQFELRATDPRWVAHVRNGSTWRSTCPSF